MNGVVGEWERSRCESLLGFDFRNLHLEPPLF
ncbi:hypothetical protein SAMN04488121_11158 [Chitinophaga filiformis]|uniref:Uncharacterized protein n=1 Tax=Chitinophaga filiformis TaxID=104663 RepID=A0A1G8BIT4_CHIFI|nr:hypothetical protein SAMN04488121_11158 [Chitinophaga filiformis]